MRPMPWWAVLAAVMLLVAAAFALLLFARYLRDCYRTYNLELWNAEDPYDTVSSDSTSPSPVRRFPCLVADHTWTLPVQGPAVCPADSRRYNPREAGQVGQATGSPDEEIRQEDQQQGVQKDLGRAGWLAAAAGEAGRTGEW